MGALGLVKLSTFFKRLHAPTKASTLGVGCVLVGSVCYHIFLGQDPRVTATMRDLKREAGTQGFLSKENTVVWHWEIEVRNARSHPVNLQVEDPAPNPAADVFSVKLESKPIPESVLTDPLQGGRKIYRWSMELKPGASSVIDHQVTVSGPSDKPFEPGRGTR